MSRNLIFYVLLMAIFGSLLWFVFNQGAKLEVLQSPQTSAKNSEIEATADEEVIVARPGQVMNPFGPQPDVRETDLGQVAEQILAVELGQG